MKLVITVKFKNIVGYLSNKSNDKNTQFELDKSEAMVFSSVSDADKYGGKLKENGYENVNIELVSE